MKKRFWKFFIFYYNVSLWIRKAMRKEKGLIVHLYTLCWNEERLLPFFIDYYSEIVQKITIYDNYSTDGSEQIMRQNKKVSILKYNSNSTINDLLYLNIKNNSWKKSRGKADFVIVCDIDEFLYSNNLNDTIMFLKENKYTIIKPDGFQMVSEDFPQYSKGKKITEIVKTGFSDNRWLSKSILFDPNKIIEINYSAGAHDCTPLGIINWYEGDKTKMLHYKDLSLEYIIHRKKEFGKRLSQMNLKEGWGTYYLEDENKTTEVFKERVQRSTNII